MGQLTESWNLQTIIYTTTNLSEDHKIIVAQSLMSHQPEFLFRMMKCSKIYYGNVAQLFEYTKNH